MRLGTTLLGVVILYALLASAAFGAGSTNAVVREARARTPQPIAFTSLLRLAIGSRGVVADVLRHDARILGGFEVLDRRSIPAVRLDEEVVDKKAWIELGVGALIRHRIEGHRVHFELYDFAKGSKPVLAKTDSAKDLRTASHRFMNDVVKYWTGIPGAFDSRIAFVRDGNRSKNVFTMDVTGDRVRAITNNRSLNVLPSIGPGGAVLFTSYAKRNPDLWHHHDGRSMRVSRRPGLNLGGVFSPDGRSIAVALSVDGNPELYTLDPQGAVRHRLTRDPASDGSPTWNASGDALAFVSDRGGTPQVYRVRASGADVERLTFEGEYNVSPDWAKGEGDEAQRIAYTGRRDSREGIFLLEPKTSRTSRITPEGSRQESPSWSPSGWMLAFESHDPPGIAIWADPGWFAPVLVHRGGSQPSWGPRVTR